MDVLKNPAWLVPAVLFLLHQLAQYGLGWSVPLADSFLDPLLCFPILLGLLLIERRWLFDVQRLGWFETATATVVLAVIFEVVFPWLKRDFTADPLDLIAYALGAVYFYFLINPRPRG